MEELSDEQVIQQLQELSRYQGKDKALYSKCLSAYYSYVALKKWQQGKNTFGEARLKSVCEKNEQEETKTAEGIGEIVKMVMPTTASKKLMDYHVNHVESKVRSAIRHARSAAIDEFCLEHNLCETCVTGGYNCGSDHK